MMFTSLKSTKRGFTLIELLVVIAIIGILSSVVLASLSTARQKARDATRISDIKNIQLALELYYDSVQGYPSYSGAAATQGSDLSAAATAANVMGKLIGFTAGTAVYIPRIPIDPQGTSAAGQYSYIGVTNAAAQCLVDTPATCPSYVLGATLETANNVLGNDDDSIAIANVFEGMGVTCTAAAAGTAGPAGTERCYSIRP